MKFKVGDRVRLVRMEDENVSYEKYLRKEFEIEAIFNGFYPFCKLKGNNGIVPYLKNLELVKEYTYEDLKKSPIGTKIVFEKGEVLVKYDYYWYNGDSYLRNDSDLKELKDKDKQLGKIIKIEEPEYRTVYEAKVEILDEVEKRYLKNIIRPYLDKIKSIEKFIFSTGRAKITITVKDGNDYWYIDLPPFKKETMYKNMGDDKEYTLEELGL